MLLPGFSSVGMVTLAEGSAAKPSGRRRVEIDWDHGVKLPAVEIRPGIAVSADVDVNAKRSKDYFGENVEITHPVLGEDEFVNEIEQVLSLIESTFMGKRLVAFFGACHPLPNGNGTLAGSYSANPVLGINPRVLRARSASDPAQHLTVNLVIVQNQDFADSCHGIGPRFFTTGYGAFATIGVSPRTGMLIDDICLAPEISLAHEMVHAVHVLSGSFHQSEHVGDDDPVKSPEMLAEYLLLAQTGVSLVDLEKWRDPANQAAWEKLSAAAKKQIEDLRAEHSRLLELAKRVLQPAMPAALEAGQVFFQIPIVSLEEAKTTGSDATAAWFQGVRQEVDLRRLGVSRAETLSDQVAAANIKRVEEYGRKNPSDKAVPEALKRAKEIRQLRLGVRELSEARLSRAMSLPIRASYAPTRSKLTPEGVRRLFNRPFHLTRQRKDIAKQAFQATAPFSALVAALPADSATPGEPTPVADIREYVAALQAWDSGAPAATHAPGWRPGDHALRDCSTRKPLTTVTVDPATVPQPVREQAMAVVQDALSHPDTPTSTLENERLRPAKPVPLPPAR